jgi:hypothetical protein
MREATRIPVRHYADTRVVPHGAREEGGLGAVLPQAGCPPHNPY